MTEVSHYTSRNTLRYSGVCVIDVSAETVNLICFTQAAVTHNCLRLDNAPGHCAHSQRHPQHLPLVAMPPKSGLLQQEGPIHHCTAHHVFHINCGEHNRWAPLFLPGLSGCHCVWEGISIVPSADWMPFQPHSSLGRFSGCMSSVPLSAAQCLRMVSWASSAMEMQHYQGDSSQHHDQRYFWYGLEIVLVLWDPTTLTHAEL